MPELYLTTRAVCESEELAINSILVTDGRFSGATLGPVIGHIRRRQWKVDRLPWWKTAI